MMKIHYVNSFGKFEHYDFIITEVLADVATYEQSDAMDQGFLYRQGAWRQCRSTRSRLSKTSYSMLPDSEILIDYDYDQLLEINQAFLAHKKFTLAPHDIHITKNDLIWGYYHQNNLVAWSKIHCYNHELEAAYFAWDYANPRLQLGLKSLKHEIAWAKAQGYYYLYLGPGYEQCSIYKSRIQGFEWWTGSEWSTDAEKYTWLCERETGINNFGQYSDSVNI